MSVLDLYDLSDRVAIVTGAARGLGRQSALALAEAGADVAICDLLEAQGEGTARDIEALGRRSVFARADVTHSEQVDAFVRQVINTLGKVDILVNNVGIPSQGRALEDENDTFWRHIVETNMSSVFYVSRAAAQHMIERAEGGVIINMGSMSGLIINNISPRRNVPYCATKAGVLHLTRGMASDWARYGIRVNAIAPGYMVTEQTSFIDSELEQRLLANTPMGRFGQVDELKGTVVYLALRASSFVTGSVIVVDGGTTIW